MNLILGLDLETTSLDPNTARIIEIGAVLYDIDRKRPVELLSFLVKHPGLIIPPEIVTLTGIEPEYIQRFGRERGEVFLTLNHLANQADALVAHNGAAFDLPVLTNNLHDGGFSLSMTNLPLIDTMTDPPYPPEMGSCRKLRHLCAEHGFIHDDSAHRAVFDVMAMLRVLSHYDIPALIERSKSPQVIIRANISYLDRQLAKDAGFQWDPQQRAWMKTIRELDWPQESRRSEFSVSRAKVS